MSSRSTLRSTVCMHLAEHQGSIREQSNAVKVDTELVIAHLRFLAYW